MTKLTKRFPQLLILITLLFSLSTFLTLLLKGHKAFVLDSRIHWANLFFLFRQDLLFYLFFAILFLVYSRSKTSRPRRGTFFLLYLFFLSNIWMEGICHIFFLRSGSLANGHLLRHLITHYTDITALIRSEFHGGLVLFCVLPLLGLIFSYMLAKQESLGQWLSLKLKGVQNSFFPVAVLILLLIPPSPKLLGSLQPLSSNLLVSLSTDLLDSLQSLEELKSQIPRKDRLFDAKNLKLTKLSKGKKLNLVMILLESTRSRAITPYNAKRKTTPFLQRLAQKSLQVEKMYAIIPHTSKAMVAILCGIYPKLSLEIYEGKQGGIPAKCLPQMLEENGYDSAYFTTSTMLFEGFAQMAKNMGFSTVKGLEDFDTRGFSKTNYFGYEDRMILKPMLKWVDQKRKQETPFFLTYITLLTHYEYGLPKGFKQKRYAPGTDWDYFHYLNAQRYVDNFLKDLFKEFKKRGLYKNTLFVLVGDHGEGFGEHDRRQHDNVIWDEGLEVPALFFAPSLIKKAKKIKGIHQQVDILPTITELLGTQIQDGFLPGRSLLKKTSKKKKLFFSCWYEKQCMALREGSFKYIYHYDRRPMEIYHLLEDPLEKKDLSSQKKFSKEFKQEKVRQMLEWHKKVNQHYYPSKPQRKQVDLRFFSPLYQANIKLGRSLTLTSYQWSYRVKPERSKPKKHSKRASNVQKKSPRPQLKKTLQIRLFLKKHHPFSKKQELSIYLLSKTPAELLYFEQGLNPSQRQILEQKDPQKSLILLYQMDIKAAISNFHSLSVYLCLREKVIKEHKPVGKQSDKKVQKKITSKPFKKRLFRDKKRVCSIQLFEFPLAKSQKSF